MGRVAQPLTNAAAQASSSTAATSQAALAPGQAVAGQAPAATPGTAIAPADELPPARREKRKRYTENTRFQPSRWAKQEPDRSIVYSEPPPADVLKGSPPLQLAWWNVQSKNNVEGVKQTRKIATEVVLSNLVSMIKAGCSLLLLVEVTHRHQGLIKKLRSGISPHLRIRSHFYSNSDKNGDVGRCSYLLVWVTSSWRPPVPVPALVINESDDEVSEAVKAAGKAIEQLRSSIGTPNVNLPVLLGLARQAAIAAKAAVESIRLTTFTSIDQALETAANDALNACVAGNAALHGKGADPAADAMRHFGEVLDNAEKVRAGVERLNFSAPSESTPRPTGASTRRPYLSLTIHGMRLVLCHATASQQGASLDIATFIGDLGDRGDTVLLGDLNFDFSKQGGWGDLKQFGAYRPVELPPHEGGTHRGGRNLDYAYTNSRRRVACFFPIENYDFGPPRRKKPKLHEASIASSSIASSSSATPTAALQPAQQDPPRPPDHMPVGLKIYAPPTTDNGGNGMATDN